MMRIWTVNEEQLDAMFRTVSLLSAYGTRVESLTAELDKVLAQIETGSLDEPVSKSQMTFIDQETSDFLKDWIDFKGPHDRGMEDGITGVY